MRGKPPPRYSPGRSPGIPLPPLLGSAPDPGWPDIIFPGFYSEKTDLAGWKSFAPHGHQDILTLFLLWGGSATSCAAALRPANIGELINTRIIKTIIDANTTLSRFDLPDFNGDVKMGKRVEKVDLLTDLIAAFENKALVFSPNQAGGILCSRRYCFGGCERHDHRNLSLVVGIYVGFGHAKCRPFVKRAHGRWVLFQPDAYT